MDKLTVINNALSNTGNSTVNILHDPSDEYRVADTAFDRAIKFLTSMHAWPFSTTVENLVRVPDDENLSKLYPQNGFRIPSPPQVLHVKEIYYCNRLLTEFEIIGFILSCCHSNSISAKVVREAPGAIWHPMAEEVLTLMVESGLLRGLNEDLTEARVRNQEAQALIATTRAHLDQQNPARNTYVSKIARARRTRRV
jgi:hypothetical protein